MESVDRVVAGAVSVRGGGISTGRARLALCGLFLLSAALLNVTVYAAVFCIVVSAVLIAVRVSNRPVVPTPVFWASLFILYCAISGMLFGGVEAIRTGGVVPWAGQEGRLFLFFWPMMFCVLFVVSGTPRSLQFLNRLFYVATLGLLFLMILKATSGFSSFRTHHGAGAFAATMVLYMFWQYRHSNSRANLFFLVASIAALLGTNSRTALVAVSLTLAFALISTLEIKRFVKVFAISACLVAAMPFLFPKEYDRIASIDYGSTYNVLVDSFYRGLWDERPTEVSRAWRLGDRLHAYEGDANLAIRGYLWGHAVNLALRSPVLGVGFGRYNDIGREFEGVKYLVYPVTDVRENVNTAHTAHNTFLHHLAETGLLGLGLLFMVVWSLWRGPHTNPAVEDRSNPWRYIGRSALVCMAIMGVTQHSFGAPIYGLTLFMLAGLSFGLRRGAAPLEKSHQTSPQPNPAVLARVGRSPFSQPT